MIKIRFANTLSIALVIGLVAGLCGCEAITDILTGIDAGESDGTDINILYAPIPMDIGVVAPLTGRYAPIYGLSMERGLLLARDEINSFRLSPFRLNFITEDNRSTVEGSVAAFERLVDAGVPAIVGLAISTHAKESFPIAQENQVVAFSPLSSAAGLSSIGDYIFRAALAVDRLNPGGVRTTHAQLGYERVAMIYDDTDVFSTSSNEHFVAALEDLGVEVVTTQTFQTGDTDFTAQLTTIMESNPEALFISALGVEVAKIMTQGREIGITTQYITPLLGISDARMAGDAAEGTITFKNWASTLDNPLNHIFVENYRAAYGIEPDTWAAQSYATLFILFNAMVNALSTDTVAPSSAAIRDALATTRDIDTNLGQFSFDPNGEAIHEPVVLIVRDGALQLFGDGE